MFLDHLVDFQEKGFVADGPTHTLLIETELCCGDGLAVRDQREVELKLLVVTPLGRELSVVLHCGTDTQKADTRVGLAWLARLCRPKIRQINPS